MLLWCPESQKTHESEAPDPAQLNQSKPCEGRLVFRQSSLHFLRILYVQLGWGEVLRTTELSSFIHMMAAGNNMMYNMWHYCTVYICTMIPHAIDTTHLPPSDHHATASSEYQQADGDSNHNPVAVVSLQPDSSQCGSPVPINEVFLLSKLQV